MRHTVSDVCRRHLLATPSRGTRCAFTPKTQAKIQPRCDLRYSRCGRGISLWRSLLGVKRTCPFALQMSAFDAVDGAPSAASKCYRVVALKRLRLKEVRPGNEAAFEVLKELARTRRRNADKVDPGIGRTRMGQRIFECVLSIGTRSAQGIMASGLIAAQTGPT